MTYKHKDWHGTEAVSDREVIRSPEEKRRINAMIARYQRKKRKRRIIKLAVFLLIIIGAYVIYKQNVKPPTIERNPEISSDLIITQPYENQAPVKTEPNRKEEFYTFAIIGKDDGNGNTDTMILGAFDNKNKKLNLVSIPRDTLVNVPWSVKKANTFMSHSDDAIEGLKEGLRNLAGFTIDNYFIVDLKAFKAVVDTIGGVDFDVPIDMDYEDPCQDLYIHIASGYQHLDGEHALQVVRFRSGYPDQDIGRIATQQAFLKAVAKKCFRLENITKVSDFAKIFSEHIDTDLELGNMIWYGTEVLDLKEEDISFSTLPAFYGDYINGTSYCSILLDEWISLINSSLNPYAEDITVLDLDILTRDEEGKLYATTGEILGNIA